MYIYSWPHRRPRDLSGSLSPLILRRLNHYGNRHCICVLLFPACSGDLWGTLFRRPAILCRLKPAILISLPKEKLNLIVMIKVTANSQLKRPSLLPLIPAPSHHGPPPSSPEEELSTMEVSWEGKGSEE